MFEYEKCIQEVKEAGIEFTEAERLISVVPELTELILLIPYMKST